MPRTLHHFLPHRALVTQIVPESADTRTFVLTLDAPLAAFEAARPGQFAMLSVRGHGEAAFTLSDLPSAGAARGTVVFTIRRVGALTSALFELDLGASVGVRGPFGRGFPEEDDSVPTAYIAGGCGLAPLKAAIDLHIATRTARTPIAVLYGARDFDSRIHRAALAAWQGAPNVHLIECLEHADATWQGRVGFVGAHVEEAVTSVNARRAAVCGPPPMLLAVAERLCSLGLPADEIHLAVERYMKCGTGICGHCYVNHRYACVDGPVFSFAELQSLPDAFVTLNRKRETTDEHR